MNSFFSFTLKGSDGYGKKDENFTISEDDAEKLDLAVFNEDDLEQHQQKIFVGCGLFFRISWK